ncbi:hypothetical protein D3C81_1113330 [compost metagenome]
MEFEHERHEVLAREAALAPITLAQGLAADRVQIEHGVLFGIGFAARRIGTRHGSQQCRVTRLVRIFHIPDLQPREPPLQVVHQGARWQCLPTGRCVIEARVEPLIDLVLKRQDASGETSQGKKQGNPQADVTVQQYIEVTHERALDS